MMLSQTSWQDPAAGGTACPVSPHPLVHAGRGVPEPAQAVGIVMITASRALSRLKRPSSSKLLR